MRAILPGRRKTHHRAAPGVLLLALFVLPAAASAPAPQGWQPPPPPRTWNAAEHHGYMDGVQAAWLDLADHLRPKPSRHLDYLHPPNVKINRRYQYREGFRQGYEVVYRHDRLHPEQTAQAHGL